MERDTGIYEALAKAQAQMTKAKKQSENPHFRSKYADLSSVVDACMAALSEQKIAVFHKTIETEFGRYVRTTLAISINEMIECDIPLIIGKNDMQGLGSAITYARRYGLMCLAGIAPEDDDGNAAAANAPKQMGWAETIIAELPETATEMEKAEAVTKALIAQFKRKKTPGEMSNEWDRRVNLIKSIESRFPEMHAQIVDAYENQINDITPKEDAA